MTITRTAAGSRYQTVIAYVTISALDVRPALAVLDTTTGRRYWIALDDTPHARQLAAQLAAALDESPARVARARRRIARALDQGRPRRAPR